MPGMDRMEQIEQRVDRGFGATAMKFQSYCRWFYILTMVALGVIAFFHGAIGGIWGSVIGGVWFAATILFFLMEDSRKSAKPGPADSCPQNPDATHPKLD